MTRVRVVGVGNVEAGDDAIGVLAVRVARPELEALGAEVVEVGAGVHVVDLLEGVDAVVVVDAVREPSGGRPPGTIVRVEAGPDGLPAELGSSLSSHGFGVAEAVALATALGRVPRVVVLGIEAVDVVAGHGPSRAVEAALPQVAACLTGEVKAQLGLEPRA